jgi:hypothetical protein
MSTEALVSRVIGLDVHRDVCEVAIREGRRFCKRQVAEVVMAHPKKLRATSDSEVKTDNVAACGDR